MKSTAVSRYQVNKIGNFWSQCAKFAHRAQKRAGTRPAFFRESVQVRSGSVPRDHRATPVEAIVDASLNRMLVVAEAGSNEDGGAGGNKGGAAEVVILVFNLGGPARREHVFEASADGVAVTMVAVGGENQRRASSGGHVDVVAVLPGITALGVKQRRTPGVAEPAGDRSKLVVVRGDQHAAREQHASVAAAKPAVLGFDTEDPGGGELIIEAALHAAEETAIVAAQAVVARERAADVATDVEAGPVVDRRAVSRRLGVGTSRHIGRQRRRGCAESDEGHSTE